MNYWQMMNLDDIMLGFYEKTQEELECVLNNKKKPFKKIKPIKPKKQYK